MGNIVVKHNDLISASYRLSLTEQRIILNCIGKIRSDLKTIESENRWFTVTIEEYALMHGVAEKQIYFELQSAVASLWERYFTVGTGDNKAEGRWVISKQVNDSMKKSISVKFHPDIMPYLSQLKENFTKYDLRHVASMTSTHAIRLYEFLAERQFQNSKRFIISVSELRERLQLQETHVLFGDINARVLKPSIKQINQHSNFNVTIEMIKEGRKITRLLFEFTIKKGKEPKRDPTKNPNKVVTKKEIEQNAKPGETRAQVSERIKKLKQSLNK